MGKETGISWTSHTFNPWWGCTKVSAGCDHCYAETLDARWGDPHWGKGVPRRTFGDKHWAEPLAWNAAAKKAGKRELVFCASMADVMDDEAPAGQRERLWELIDATPWLTWQLLTKRPTRYNSYLPEKFQHGNVWLGASAENQTFYNIRWSVLRVIAHDYDLISFISYEPALGPLSIDEYACSLPADGDRFEEYPDWIICGGESGNDRRPMEQKWAENLQSECEIGGVKFFMKQMSARTPGEGKNLIPAHLLIHEMPAA
jgi:protein gp37